MTAARKKPGLTAKQAAKHSFEGMGVLEMLDRSTFMENANNAYTTVAYAAMMLRLNNVEMAAAFKTMLDTEQDDGDAALACISAFTDAKGWFEGYVRTLECVEARGLIALSQVAVA